MRLDPKLAALSFGNFVVGMGAFVVIGVLTPMAEGLALTKAEAGSVMTAYAIAYMIASPILVAFTGQVDRRNLLVGALAIFGAASLLSALAPTLPALWGARMLAAIGAGLFTPVAAAVAVVASAPEERGRALATVFGGLTLAQVAGVPVGAWLGYTFGWPAAFTTVAALTVLAASAAARLVPSGLPFQATSLAVLGRTLVTPSVLVAVTFTATFLGAVYVVYTFLGPLIEARLGFGRDGVTLFLAVFGLGAVAGNLLGGLLTDRIGPVRTLIGLTVGQIVLIPAAAAMPGGAIAAALLIFVWSSCGWAFMVPQQARLVSVAPQAQNVVLALNAACIYVAATIGSAIGAASIASVGLENLGWVGMAGAFLALIHIVAGARMAKGPARRPA